MAIGIIVEEILIRSLDVDNYVVTWKVKTTSEDLLDYTFQVLRSEGPAGPFDEVSPELSDQYMFLDNAIRRGHEFRQFHYIIRVKQKQSGQTRDFGPANPGPDADLIATELRKHMFLLMREFIGRRCWIFPVRTFGQRCRCWDPILAKRTQSGCITCFDTGFVRGYMTPIEAWVNIDPDQQSEQTFNVGPTQQSNTTAKLGYFPQLKPRDLIIEPENIRWRVSQISGTQQLRAVVHQEVQLHKIPSTDIEYRLPFDSGVDLNTINLSPARNFTNPHTLEAYGDEEYPKVFQLYSSTYPKVTT